MKEQLEKYIRQYIEEKGAPGAVIGILKPDGTQEIVAVGNFEYDPTSPKMQDDSIFDIASITKSIATEAVILRLIEEGEINLADPVVKYLTEFGSHEGKEKVTIEHLIKYKLDMNVPSSSSLKHLPPDEIVHSLLTAPLKVPAGMYFRYTNTAAMIIGLVIKKATGVGLDELADQYFFKPLGMKSTTFHPEIFDKEEIPEKIVPTEIDSWRGKVQGVVHDEATYTLQPKYFTGISGVFSNAPDLLKYIKMLLNNGSLNGTQFLKQETIEQFYTNQNTGIMKHGLGYFIESILFTNKHEQEVMFGIRGFTGTMILILPKRKIGIVILSNRTFPKRPKNNSVFTEFRIQATDHILDQLI